MLDIHIWIAGKKRRKLLWRLAKRQLHQYTTFRPLAVMNSRCVSQRQVEIFGLNSDAGKAFNGQKAATLNFHSSLAMAYQKNGGQTTRKGSNTSWCLFHVASYYHFFPRVSRLEDIIERGKHYTMTSEILEWNSWQKFPPNCGTGCVDGVLQRQRPLGSDDFPRKGQVDQKMVQMCRYGWKVCC